MESNHPFIDLTDTVGRLKGLHPLIESLDYLPERFARKVLADGECWLWIAAKDPCGYGQFFWNGRPHKAHRVAYELVVGGIPAGLELDHLCRVRHCVRPSHMEAVTHRVNLLRGDTFQAKHAAKTHCHRGHAFDEANTHWMSNGARRCRHCNRIRANAANAARRYVNRTER